MCLCWAGWQTDMPWDNQVGLNCGGEVDNANLWMVAIKCQRQVLYTNERMQLLPKELYHRFAPGFVEWDFQRVCQLNLEKLEGSHIQITFYILKGQVIPFTLPYPEYSRELGWNDNCSHMAILSLYWESPYLVKWCLYWNRPLVVWPWYQPWWFALGCPAIITAPLPDTDTTPSVCSTELILGEKWGT